MPHTAVLMAGGCGTRGRPYTEFIPKSAIPVNGRPVIAHVAEYLASLPEISEIIILSDFTGLGEQIRNYFGSSKVNGKRIKFIQDSQSGTGGDLLHLRPHLKAGNFILWFADNICAVDAASMLHTLKMTKTLACVAMRSSRKEETGFADVEGDIVKRFVEKPTVKLPERNASAYMHYLLKYFHTLYLQKRKNPR